MLMKHSGFKIFSRKKILVAILSFVLAVTSIIAAVSKNMVAQESYADGGYTIEFYDMLDNTLVLTWTCNYIQSDGTCFITDALGMLHYHEGYELGSVVSSDSRNHFYPRTEFWVFYGDTTISLYYNQLAKYTLKFDTNGGSSVPANEMCYVGGGDNSCNVLIPDDIPVYDGRTFQGYGLSADAPEVAYQPGDNITLTSFNTTLYALWTPATRRLTLHYKNGNNSTTTLACYTATLSGSCPISIPDNVPIYDNYAFYGYAELPDSSRVSYQPGDTVVLTGNKDLYAVWLPVYTAYYDLGYGDNYGTIETCESDIFGSCDIQLPSEVPERDSDYSFLGWGTDEKPTIVAYAPGDTATIYRNTTFYAVWQGNQIGAECNSGALDINDALCLQDMNGFIKESMEVGTAYELIDSRDGKMYRLAKLDDGNVWLLDNLAIGGYAGITLTLGDTNTDPSINNGEFLLPASNSGSWNSFTEPMIDISMANEVLIEDGDRAIGGYYNYCAATAGTACEEGPGGGEVMMLSVGGSRKEGNEDGSELVETEYDICPAGWRMPTGGEDGEYGNLANFYDARGVADALLLPYGGYYADFSDTLWWSSTYTENSVLSYAVGMIDDGGKTALLELMADPTVITDRNRWQAIRCIANMDEKGSGDHEWKDDIDEYTINSDGELIFIIDLPLRTLTSVKVDGEELDGKNYELKSGSTIINLQTDFLDTMTVGDHTLVATYNSGLEVTTEFTVHEAVEDDSPVPDTGEDVDVPYTGINSRDNGTDGYGWLMTASVLSGFAVLFIVGVVLDRRKHKIKCKW